MNNVHHAFGKDADLYSVLGISDREDAENPAKLRKAYFRKALVYHPDKTTEPNAEVAKSKFQAISFAYQVLKNPETRTEYNDSGHVDEEHDGDHDDLNAATRNWKDYFDLIFGKLTTSKIDQFALKYKCSEEEQNDVLNHYQQFKGDLNKMLGYVMLSEPLDARRWLEDYIQPAIDHGTVPDYRDMIHKSLQKIEKKIERELQKKQNKETSKKENQNPPSDDDEEGDAEEDEMTDEDATETESDDGQKGETASPHPKKNPKRSAPRSSSNKANPTKAKPTNAKTQAKKGKGKQDDLVAMIQANQSKRSGNSFFTDMAAKYGEQMQDDPLGDEEFAKIQARLTKKTKKKRAR